MRQTLLSLLLSVFLLLPVHARDWSTVVRKVAPSIVSVVYPVEEHFDTCTGFVINQKKGLVLTADHCYGEGLLVNDKPAWVVYKDPIQDLLVLGTVFTPKALKPRIKPVTLGMELGVLGLGYGQMVMLFRAGHVSHLNMQWGPELFLMLSDNPYIRGSSGGPVFDTDGNVIGIVQRTDSTSGSGVSIRTILKSTGKHWSN